MLGVKDGIVDRVALHRPRLRDQPGQRLAPDRRDQGQAARRRRRHPRRRLLDLLGIEISPARLKCAMLSHDSLQHVLDRPRRADPRTTPSRPRPAHDPRSSAAAGVGRRPDAGSPSQPRRIVAADRPTALAPSRRQPVEHRSPSPHAKVLRRPPSRGPRPDQGSHPAGGRRPARGRGHDRRRPRGVRVGAGPPARRPPRLQELHRAADRGRRPRSRRAGRSCTAPAASARCSPPRRWPRWATPTSPRCPAASRPGRAPGSSSRRRSS